MARSRNIKPSFFINDELGDCTIPARLLFIALWTLADREGRLEHRPKRIKAASFPYDDDVDVVPLISELESHGFIETYTVDGINVLAIPNFVKHQNPHYKERDSELPPRLDQACSNVEPQDQANLDPSIPTLPCTDPADSLLLNPESPLLNPDSGSLKPDAPSTDVDAPSPEDHSVEFDQFWEHYPRKVSKQAARKAFSRLSRVKRKRAITAVVDYAVSPQGRDSDRELIPHPATWLNGGRFDDERAEWQHPMTKSPRGSPGRSELPDQLVDGKIHPDDRNRNDAF